MGQKINQRIFRSGSLNNNYQYFYNSFLKQKYTNYFLLNNFIDKFLINFFQLFNIFLNDIKLVYYRNSTICIIKPYTLFSCNYTFFLKIVKNHRKIYTWLIIFIKLNFYKIYFFLISKASILLSNYSQKTNFKFLVSFLKEKSLIKLCSEHQKASYAKLKLQLRKYVSTDFFKECFCILLSTVKLHNFSNLISSYLKLEFNKLKKHNFFLTFLKRALIFFVYSSFSKIKGIKILIKGRLNGKPRSSKKLIQIGRISSQSFDSKISSTKKTAFSALGTFGIKIWICEKSI